VKKIAFLTTIFPMEESFITEFLESLSNQTYNKFDIIVVNDGFKNLNNIVKKHPNLNIKEILYSNTPAKNRECGINYVISQKYDILIFGDSDDYFSENRVEKTIELLEKTDIVVNDLSLFNENGIYENMYISNRIPNNTLVKYDYIKDKNIFGLSNTALNLNILESFSIDADIIAVDWYLYKKLLKEKNRAIFTNECITYYRQYVDNTVGLESKNGNYLLWWESNNKDNK